MSTQQGKVPGIRREGSSVLGPSIEVRMSQGKALRERVSRTSHAEWSAPSARPDPIKVLRHSGRGGPPHTLSSFATGCGNRLLRFSGVPRQ